MRNYFQPKLRKIVAAGVLLINAALCLATPQQAQKRPANLIRVWAVGSPHTSTLPEKAIPLELRQRAETGGYLLEVESLSAAEFPERLRRAVQTHEEPEILTFRNFGIVAGHNTPSGSYQGLLQTDFEIAASLEAVFESLSTLQAGGLSVVLLRTALNYESARTMALQSPRCPGVSGVSQSAADKSSAVETAMIGARAYLTGNEGALAALADDSKLGKRPFLPNMDVQLGKLQPCSVWENERLAFVSLVSTFWVKTRAAAPHQESSYSTWLMTSPIGQQSLLAVLRNRDGVWRLMTITDDPINTGASGVPTIKALNELRSQLVEKATDAAVPAPALLLTPDRADLRRPPNSPCRTFLWQPSPDEAVVCEIAEFLVGDNPHPRERTRLFFLFRREGQVSAGMLWGRAGTWRVWSVSRAGTVSLSAAHSYRTH